MAAVPVCADVIKDNRDSTTSRTGTWSASAGTPSYGPDNLFARDGATFTWRFTPPQTGDYEVMMWWTYREGRSTSVPVAINHAGGTTTVTINQQANGGQWNSLGEFSFQAGVTYNVTITAQPSPSSTRADAVWFRLVSGNTPPVASIVSINPTLADPGQPVQFAGTGTDSDGTVVAYGWQSSLDGVLSNAASFTRTSPSLSAGVHAISFRVRDDQGIWSSAATAVVVVGPARDISPSTQAGATRVMNVYPYQHIEWEGDHGR